MPKTSFILFIVFVTFKVTLAAAADSTAIYAESQRAVTTIRAGFNGLLPMFQDEYGREIAPMTASCRGQSVSGSKLTWWGTPTARWNDRSGEISGFELLVYGAALGTTYRIDRYNQIGLAFGYDLADLDIRKTTAKDKFQALNFALYGGYLNDGDFFDYQIGYGINFHDVDRTENDTYSASYNDNLLSVGGMYGHRFGIFYPSLGVEFTQVWTSSFSESETGSEPEIGTENQQITSKSDFMSLEFPIGFRCRPTVRTSSSQFDVTPEARLFWVPQVGDPCSRISALTPLESDDLGWQHFRIGAGVSGRYQSWTSSLNYDATMYSDKTGHAVSASISARF